MIIDFHTHAFPERIAERAIEKLSYTSGGLIPQTDGTVESLKYLMKKDGIDKSVVLAIATNEKQQTAVNDFIKSQETDDIIPFGSVYPHAENALEELERIHSMGLKGIKLHPEYQQFFVDDEKMKSIYKKISELGLIVLFHAGEDFGYPAPYHATPERLRKAAKWIDTPMICAHWGGAGMGEDVLKYLCDIPVFFDTAFGYGTMPKDRAQRILDKKGVDYIIFGSDCPWHAPSWDIKMIETLELTESEKDKIYYKNAQILLNI
ncbi:MAG: amidohydrolase family protein [Clostridia bacterium]|nr:amidohydrolase family protein [Clostridia bacterium]